MGLPATKKSLPWPTSLCCVRIERVSGRLWLHGRTVLLNSVRGEKVLSLRQPVAMPRRRFHTSYRASASVSTSAANADVQQSGAAAFVGFGTREARLLRMQEHTSTRTKRLRSHAPQACSAQCSARLACLLGGLKNVASGLTRLSPRRSGRAALGGAVARGRQSRFVTGLCSNATVAVLLSNHVRRSSGLCARPHAASAAIADGGEPLRVRSAHTRVLFVRVPSLTLLFKPH